MYVICSHKSEDLPQDPASAGENGSGGKGDEKRNLVDGENGSDGNGDKELDLGDKGKGSGGNGDDLGDKGKGSGGNGDEEQDIGYKRKGSGGKGDEKRNFVGGETGSGENGDDLGDKGKGGGGNGENVDLGDGENGSSGNGDEELDLGGSKKGSGDEELDLRGGEKGSGGEECGNGENGSASVKVDMQNVDMSSSELENDHTMSESIDGTGTSEYRTILKSDEQTNNVTSDEQMNSDEQMGSAFGSSSTEELSKYFPNAQCNTTSLDTLNVVDSVCPKKIFQSDGGAGVGNESDESDESSEMIDKTVEVTIVKESGDPKVLQACTERWPEKKGFTVQSETIFQNLSAKSDGQLEYVYTLKAVIESTTSQEEIETVELTDKLRRQQLNAIQEYSGCNKR